jgi:hypothetical protein
MGQITDRKSERDLKTHRPGAWSARDLLCFIWAYHRVAVRLAHRNAADSSTALAMLATNPEPIPHVQTPPENAAEDVPWGFWRGAVWVRRRSLPQLTKEAVAEADRNLLAAGKTVRRNLEHLQTLVADGQRDLADFGSVFGEDESDVRALRRLFDIAPSMLRFLGHVVIAAEHLTRHDADDVAVREGFYWLGVADFPEVMELTEEGRLRLLRRQVEPVPELPLSQVGANRSSAKKPLSIGASRFSIVAGQVTPIIFAALGLAADGVSRPSIISVHSDNPQDASALQEALREVSQKQGWQSVNAIAVVTNLDRHKALAVLASDRRVGRRHVLLIDAHGLADFIQRVPWLIDTLRHDPTPASLAAQSLVDFVAQLDCWCVLRALSPYTESVHVRTLERIWREFAHRSDLESALRNLEPFGVRRDGFTIHINQRRFCAIGDLTVVAAINGARQAFEDWLETCGSRDDELAAIHEAMTEWRRPTEASLSQGQLRQLNRALRLLRTDHVTSARIAFDELMASTNEDAQSELMDRWRNELLTIKNDEIAMQGTQMAVAHAPNELESYVALRWPGERRLPQLFALLEWYVRKQHPLEHLLNVVDRRFYNVSPTAAINALLEEIRTIARTDQDLARFDALQERWEQWRQVWERSPSVVDHF